MMSEKTKRNRRDTRKDQEIRTRCRSRLKEKGSSLGEYRRTQGNPSTMSEKRSYLGEYRRRDCIWASTEEYKIDGRSNPSKYRRIQDRKDCIRASTGEGSGRVSEKGPGEYRKRVWASTRKGFGRVPGKVESKRLSEKGRIRVSTGEGSNPGKYQKKVWASTGKGRIQTSTGEG